MTRKEFNHLRWLYKIGVPIEGRVIAEGQFWRTPQPSGYLSQDNYEKCVEDGIPQIEYRIKPQ